MKKKIKFLIRSIFVSFIVIICFNSFGQNPSVTINYNGTNVTPGSTISVPVVINSTTNIGTWQIIIYYNRDVLKFTSYTADPVWTGGIGPSFNSNYKVTLGQHINDTCLKAQFVYSGSGFTCSNRTAFTLNFTYVGGTTAFQFVNVNLGTNINYTYLKDPTNINTNTTWNNGSVSGSLVPITSLIGGGFWSAASTWDLNHSPNASNYVTIASALTTPVIDTITNASIAGNLTINPGCGFTISSGKNLTVNGNFLIKSNSTNTGSFIQNGTFTATNTKVEQYISANKWHMVSIPITNSTASIFDASVNGGDSIYVKYLQNNSWNWIYSLSTPIVANQGYFVWADTTYFHTLSPTLNYVGTLNSSNQNISTVGGSAWQMIGNSYTSAIDWSTVTNSSNAAGSAYYCWNPITGSYASYSLGVSTNGATQYIPAMQGFFIKSLNTNGISLTSANKVHNSQAFYKSTSSINNLIRLTTTIGSKSDEMLVLFDQNATNNYDDAFDVNKLLANDNTMPEIYTIAGTEKLVINRFGTYPYVVPFNVNLLQSVGNNSITITASDLSNFDANASIMLEDLLTSTTQDLRLNPTYTFTASVGTNSGRFVLHFLNPTFGISENIKNNVSIYSNENNIYINSKEIVKGISVYNMLGQEIIKNAGTNGQSFYKLSVDNGPANYIVRVLTNKGVSTEKVFIK